MKEMCYPFPSSHFFAIFSFFDISGEDLNVKQALQLPRDKGET